MNPKLQLTMIMAAVLLTACFSNPISAQDTQAEPNLDQQSIAKQMMEQQSAINQIIQAAHSPDLQKELELVPEQVEKLTTIAQEYQTAMMDVYRDNQDVQLELQQLMKDGKHKEAGELGKKLQKQYLNTYTGIRERIDELLLPHQLERLKQLSKQQSVKYLNKFQDEFGTPLALAEELELSDDQKEKLSQTIDRVRKKYYEDVEALKKRAHDQIYAQLTAQQREKMKGILGDTYDAEKQRRVDANERRKQARERMEKQAEVAADKDD